MTARRNSSTYSVCALSRRPVSAVRRRVYASVARSATSSACTRATVPAGAPTPRENTLRPRFSATDQLSPAARTRRVRAASPGGINTQPLGTVRIVPSGARTVFGAGVLHRFPGLLLDRLQFGERERERALV